MYDFIDKLEQSIREVFDTMIFIAVEREKDLDSFPWPPDHQCSAMIGLAGEDSGLIYFMCSAEFAQRITSSMLCMDVGEDWDSVIDAMGEVANLIGGSLKNKVARFENHRLSLPSVVVGENFEMHTPGATSGEILGFKSDNAHFLVRIVLKN